MASRAWQIGRAWIGPNPRRSAYVLLEVVIATGLLVVGLAFIGGQIQDSGKAIRVMERRSQAMRLAEQQLAYLDLGLIDLDSVDEVLDGDFGPRFPDWGWLMTTEPTAVQGMYRLTLDVLHHIRDDQYTEDSFDFENAELAYTAYIFRPAPQALDLALDYGLTEEELADVTDKLEETGLPIDPFKLNPAMLADLDFEELIQALPILLDAFHMELGDLEAIIPPDILQDLKESGLLDGGLGEGGDGGGNGEGDGGQPQEPPE
jgi:hypothetical protein